jgi:serine/threonine protein phosphatase PrpC
MIDTVKGNPTLHTWGVFDGHGEHGHHVSRIIRERLGQIWLDQGQHLGRAFKTMQGELDKSTVDVRCSGATAVMIVMRGDVLEVANCGDSRAVLGKKTNGQVGLFSIFIF